MKLTLLLPAAPDASWALALQAGVTHAVTKAAPDLSGLPAPDDLASLRTVRDRFADAGITLVGLEGDQFDMSRIKRGQAGREQDLDRYRRMLANMGELGIELLCYNFMPRARDARHDWHRTAVNVPLRGGSLTTAFDAADLPPVDAMEFSRDELWANYTEFLQAVLPAAENARVRMALHPDDPPLAALGGVPRLFHQPQAWQRAFDLMPSPCHGVAFCQANFRLMGVELAPWARRFAEAGRLFFVHFRDVIGTAHRFTETWHDEGPTDMAAMLGLYHQLGFDGPIRDDHVPALHGESPAIPGYGRLGHLFTTGYIKGLLQAQGIPYV
jgi:mannonate dehydratase